MTAGIELGVARNTVLKDRKVFAINTLHFVSFDELLSNAMTEPGAEYAYFFSNVSGSQWWFVRIREGKVREMIPLLEWSVNSAIPVTGYAQGYIVEYTLPRIRESIEKYISSEDLNRNHLIGYFSLAPPGSPKHRDLCLNLIRSIILNKAQECVPEKRIFMGPQQGLRIGSGKAIFEDVSRYPAVLHPYLPGSILHCEFARSTAHSRVSPQSFEIARRYFNGKEDLRFLYLLRIAAFHLHFAQLCGLDFDLLVNVIMSATVSIEWGVALLKNDSIRSSDTLTLGGNLQAMKKQLAERNDTVLIVVDETRPDETQRRRKGLDMLECHIAKSSSENHLVPVLLSNHVIPELQPELSRTLELNDYEFNEESSTFRRIIQQLDAALIEEIEKNYGRYEATYRRVYYDATQAIPKAIPSRQRQIYICLISAARTYDSFLPPMFGAESERFVESWLSEEYEQPGSLDDALLHSFGVALNNEISSGRFRYIQRSKFITFDKGTDSVIVDEDNIYFETKVIKELAEDNLGLNNVNALTDTLQSSKCLAINDHHSKCYRLIVQTTAGEPDMVYTYGISKVMINAANRRLLNLAGKSDYLLTKAEFEQHSLLPLGVVANGRFVGKDIADSIKHNEHIFITGKSGKGKTFFTHNLLPSIAMLGGNSIVIDASCSSTRNEVLLALPQEVVDTMFDFINVSPGQAKMPVNPLYIGDCTDLPAKKRRIVGFIKAAAGKLSKEDSRVIAGLISQQLQRHGEITAFTPAMLRETLEKGGSAGRNALNLITSVLDDVEAIGCEELGWETFFAKHKRIPVILIDDAVGENVHELVDVLLNSLFEWQHDHAEQPLTITVDEIKRMSFADGSPLHTVMTQGRKFGIRLIGITQDYVSNDSHAIDVMKQAGTQIFFEPAKSQDRIAKDLGYKDAADAGLGSMGIGECIVSSELFNTKDGCNTKTVIPCSTLRFTDSPLYSCFRKEYSQD